jgi:hypothetical protein
MPIIGNSPTTQSFVPAIDYFNGDNVEVDFTLSRPVASVAQVQVVVEDVAQNPSSAYTVNGNTITFTSAPPNGVNNIYVYYTSPITQFIQPGQGSVSPSSLSTGGPIWDVNQNLMIGTTTSPAGNKELVLAGDYIEGVVNIGTVGSASILSLANGTVQTATLTSATPCTFTMPTNIAGKSFVLLLKQPDLGSATTATFTNVKWNAIGAPTITATLGKMDILTFIADGTNWYGSYNQGYTP